MSYFVENPNSSSPRDSSSWAGLSPIRTTLDTSDGRLRPDRRASSTRRSGHRHPSSSPSVQPPSTEPTNLNGTNLSVYNSNTRPSSRPFSDLEADAEYMEVDPPGVGDVPEFPNDGYDAYYGLGGSSHPIEPIPRSGAERGKKFVGGFVASLKRLPRAVARNVAWERSQPGPSSGKRRDEKREHATWHRHRALAPATEQAPPYGSAEGQPMPVLVGDNVLVVEALDMPREHPAVPPSSYPPSKHLNAHTSNSPHYTQRSPSHLSVAGNGNEHLSQRSSVRRTSYVSVPTVRNPDPESDGEHEGTSSESSGHRHVPNAREEGVHFDVRAERHPSSYHHPNPTTTEVDTPITPQLKPSSDYARMQSPVQQPPKPSFPSQIARLFRAVGDMPFMSTEEITTEFVPRVRRDGPSTPWYIPRHASIDLLATGGSARAFTGGTINPVPQFPGASSATLLHPTASSHGHGPPQYIYTIPPPVVPTASPLFVYPTPLQPLPTSIRTDPDTSGVSSGTGTGHTGSPPQQGYPSPGPLYVLAMPQMPYLSPAPSNAMNLNQSGSTHPHTQANNERSRQA